MEKFDSDKVPEGYKVERDMFGLPYLERLTTPAQERLARIFAIPFLVVVGVVIYRILH